jgi:hypothetical protein
MTRMRRPIDLRTMRMLEQVERLRGEVRRSQRLVEESRRLLARSHDLFDAQDPADSGLHSAAGRSAPSYDDGRIPASERRRNITP